MRTVAVSLTMCLLLSIPRPTQAESPDASDLQHAIARGSAWLRGDMQTWRSEHQCGACHHGPLALFSLGALAGEQEMSSPRFLSELARWSVSDEARLMPKDPQPARLALPAVYLSLGLNSVNDRGDDLATARQRLLDHLRQTQNADGSWTGPGGRPPVFASPVEVTLLVLASWEPRRMESPETSAMLDKAAAWLRTQPAGNSHQELALRTLWLSLRGESESARLLVDRLKALQQPDGGWRQADDVPSDAFATGQSLVALRRAGIRVNDPAMQRGVRFLLETQQADGSWAMTSRPHPENHSRAANLNPIIYAGSAWAHAGLVAVSTRIPR